MASTPPASATPPSSSPVQGGGGGGGGSGRGGHHHNANRNNAPITKQPAAFITCESLEPMKSGLNLRLKVHSVKVIVDTVRKSDNTKYRVAESILGDNTASVVFTAKNEQIDVIQPGTTVEVRNARVEMFKGYMRLVVDKWGKIAKAADAAAFDVNTTKNLSTIEYELVDEAHNAGANVHSETPL